MHKKMALVLGISLSTLLVFSFWVADRTQAHEIILDFSQQAEVDEEVNIDITFGHFPDMYDYEHSFYEELESGDLTVMKPDGSEKELDFAGGEKAYSASYVPAESGVYWLTFTSTRPVVDRTDDGEGRQLRYYDAKAPLIVEHEGNPFALPETNLEVEAVTEDEIDNNAGEEITLQINYEDEPAVDQSLTAVSPREEARADATDDEGRFTFTPDEEGVWFVHVSNLTDEEEEGEFRGEEYDRVRYNSALYLQIDEKKGFFERLFD